MLWDDLKKEEKHLIPSRLEGGVLKVNLVFPNTYWIGMSNLGFQTVYRLFLESGAAVERGFVPKKTEEGSINKTFETGRDLASCDLLCYALSFESDYLNLLKQLKSLNLLSGDSSVRCVNADSKPEYNPIILAGGTAVTLNPEPIADFIDIIALGEVEELIPELTSKLVSLKRQGYSRGDILLELSKLQGLYVPSLHIPRYDGNKLVGYEAIKGVEQPKRRIVKDISKYPSSTSILTQNTEFKSMYMTETGRGCEMGCRFCVSGYIYRPTRKRAPESVESTLPIGLENSGSIGFVGASVSSHKTIAKMASQVARSGARASLSSLMSQKVSKELAISLTESEYKTVALAPEAGSERLRRAVGKRVSNHQILEAGEILVEAGIRALKLYFIIGLPTEVDEDVREIVSLSKAVRDRVVEISKATGVVAKVTLSVNPFIPKANTPFQWESMVDKKTLSRRIKLVRDSVKKTPNLEMKYESPRESYFQALMSRGDRRVGKLLLYMHENNLGWKDLMQYGDRRVLESVPEPNYYVFRKFDFDEVLPWEVVDSGISRKLLRRECERAYE